jgi:DNA-binding XRE family transcriptional regulator
VLLDTLILALVATVVKVFLDIRAKRVYTDDRNPHSTAGGIMLIDGERMRELIKEKYGSQNAFAKQANVSRQYIFQVLSGEFDPSLERLVQFAELLGVSTDELLGKELALVA